MVQLKPAQLKQRNCMPLAVYQRAAQRAVLRSLTSMRVVCAKPQSRGAAPAAAAASVETALDHQLDEAAGALASLSVGEFDSLEAAGGVDNRPGVLNMGKYRALVLDSSYRPIEVVNWQKALCMDLFDKTDVLEYYDGVFVRSAYTQFMIPAVLRVRFYVQRKNSYGRVTINRRNVFLRDNNTCQYCGSRNNLTIDHVTPLSRGGDWSWGNLVAACGACNSRKGAKTLKQLGWKLRKQPAEPSPFDVGIVCGGVMTDINAPPKEWIDYIAPFQQKTGKSRSA